MSEHSAVNTAGPFTVDSLSADLTRLGVQPGMCLLVHSSLSAIGWVCGGAQAVVMALLASLGPQGTLVMPSHSGGLSEPSQWKNPPVPQAWWQTIRDTMPAFDPACTPTRTMGAIAECFRSWPGTLRSSHPSCSFAARGPHATTIVQDNKLDFAMDDNSPLGRLYQLDAHILLLGVGHDRNTSLHLAEYRASWPGKRVITEGAPLLVNGTRVWQSYRDMAFNADDFPTIGAAFEQAQGLAPGNIGAAPARLLPQRPLVDFAAAWMEKNRS